LFALYSQLTKTSKHLFFNSTSMLYSKDLPEDLTQSATHRKAADLVGKGQPENDTDKVNHRPPYDENVFDRLHEAVYQKVQPETHGERFFLTRCLRAVLSAEGQWTEGETMNVLNALLESRAGLTVKFKEVEFTNDGFPDSQVA
jgi:hypothetical protein